MAQPVKRLTLAQVMHDLTVCEFKPFIGLAPVNTEPPLDRRLSAPPLFLLSLSLSQNE